MDRMKSKATIRCPKCGAEIPANLITHAAAQAWGKRGGAAGKGSPARRNAAICAAHARWHPAQDPLQK
jgi:hypothetical protein